MPVTFIQADKRLNAFFRSAYNREKAEILGRFFKTGPGQYGEGDKFIGINVPTLRALAKDYQEIDDVFLEELLASPYHEIRLLGALIMTLRYEQASTEKDRLGALNFYLNHHLALNNWDLVDLTVSKVWGDYLLHHPEKRKDLYHWGRSQNLWERRLAVVGTLTLIKAGQFKEILDLSVMLLDDQEDLLHQAVGWMLREVGKKDKQVLVDFLLKYAARLPRTTLRYAIEHFSETERKKYLNLKR